MASTFAISDTNAPVVGNGLALGLTDGTKNYGLSNYSGTANHATYYTNAYGESVTVSGGSLKNQPGNHPILGVTTDPTKSGIIATFSGLTLGTIPSEKLGDFYIRY